MASSDSDCEFADAGASQTYPQQAGLIRKGGFVMINKRPCKVISVSTSKTGKHGHAKAHIVGTDLFTSKKIDALCPTSHNMDIPVISRADYLVMEKDTEEREHQDDFCSLLSKSGVVKSNVRLPSNELGARIRAALEDGKSVTVNVLSACGEEAIVAFKCTEHSRRVR
mmetsp:Transcript_17638/g.41555  ORF Transcript_17638/g.41555 Transcript_17638/m.41555 type:complete len:168 (+) Transcript_17638:98-601(+)